MKIKLSELRKIIRQELVEASGSASDPGARSSQEVARAGNYYLVHWPEHIRMVGGRRFVTAPESYALKRDGKNQSLSIAPGDLVAVASMLAGVKRVA